MIKKNQQGFALLVFIIIMSLSILLMIVKYSESQKQIADNVREMIKTERRLQSVFLCVGYISNILSRYPLLNSGLILSIKNLKINESDDLNYWINKISRREGLYFNCKVLSFDNCNTGSSCDYKAIVSDDVYAKVYTEWKLDEYRFYITKLIVVN